MQWWKPPEVCRKCGNGMPLGRLKCPGCGTIHGEQNRCPFCDEFSAVKAVGSRYACANCNRIRQPKQGTVVVADHPSLEQPPLWTRSNNARHRAMGMRGAGMLSIACGFMLAGLATVAIPGVGGVLVATGFTVAGLGGGIFALRSGHRSAQRAIDHELAADELAVLELAEKTDGRLSVVQVARELQITVGRADMVLTSLVDGLRITADVNDDGTLEYVFRDPPRRRTKVRVQSDRFAHDDDGSDENAGDDAATRPR